MPLSTAVRSTQGEWVTLGPRRDSFHEPMQNPERSIREADLLAQMGWVRELARALVPDPTLAEDLAQETWLTATARPPRTLDGEHGLRAWLSTVVRNLARKEVRSKRRRVRRETDSARPESQADDSGVVERGALHSQLSTHVMQLEEPLRSAVLMRYLDELPATEVARQQGISHAAARKRISRGLAQLRARLDADHGGDRQAWSLALLSFVQVSPGTGATGAAVDATTRRTLTSLLTPAKAAVVLTAVTATLWVLSSREPQVTTSPAGESAAGSGLVETSPPSFRVGDAGESSARRPVAGAGDRPGQGSLRRLSGTVVDRSTGAPVLSGTVRLEFEEDDSPEELICSIVDGEYSFDVPRGSPLLLANLEPPKEVRGPQVIVSDTFFMGGLLETDVVLDGAPLETDRVLDLTMDPGVTLQGGVFDAETGAPVAGAFVAVLRSTAFTAWAAWSEPDGSFRITGVEHEVASTADRWPPWTIHVLHPHYSCVARTLGPAGDEPDLMNLQLLLQPGISVSGRVVDGSGAGRAGVHMLLLTGLEQTASGRPFTEYVGVKSGDDGVFTFPGVTPAKSGELITHPRMLGTAHAVRSGGVLDLTADISDLVVRLVDPVEYRIQGVRPDGTVVSGKDLTVTFEARPSHWSVNGTRGEDYREFVGDAGTRHLRRLCRRGGGERGRPRPPSGAHPAPAG
jgi:RNA polymerase sigma factor (sigma-70 family)